VIASLRWLSDLLGTPLEAEAVRDRLAMLCAPVDAMETIHGGLERVVVGLVLEAARHPNADRLSLCKVNAGGAVLGVVCGAPNVTAGKRYPFAAVGVTLPNGVTLERRKIRGEYSEGMLCSPIEIGLGADAEGILELATDAPAGTPLLDVLPLADVRFEVDVTPNRPDLLCHAGLARELGAALGLPVRLPAFPGSPGPAVPRAVRALPQSGLRRGVPVRRHLQARRGRHRPDRPGQVPRLADVRLRLPIQEDLLQLVVRQIRKVHLLLSADRGRPADGVLGDLRRPHPLSRRGAL